MRLLLSISAACLTASCTTLASTSAGISDVEIDGRFAPGEWDQAQAEKVGDAQLQTAIFNEELLVAVRLPAGSLRYVDLYVQDSLGMVRNFHTSMRQGERILPVLDRENGPPFTWEPKSGWQGSTAPQTNAPRSAPVQDRLAPYAGYEMRIPLRLLGPWPWLVRYEIRDFEQKGSDWVYPESSTLADLESWAELR